MPKSRCLRSCALSVLALLLLSAAAAMFSGCGDDKSTSTTQDLPDIQGAVVPETVQEGSPIDIEVWGRTPDENWVLTGFDVQVGAGGLVTITPEGRQDGRMMGRRGTFRGTATVPAPGPGAHTVRITGGDGHMDFAMHVFPRNAMVNLIVHGRGGNGHEQLVIGADGWALAFRMADGPPVRTQLSAAAVDSVRGFFGAAGFLDLDDRYVGDHPIEDLLYEISYRPDASHMKGVLAEDRLAPDPLKRLVDRLRRLLDRILSSAPVPPAVVASLEVDPAVAQEGTPRSITLSLLNRSASAVTLHFPSSQIYDVAIMEMNGMDGDMGHGDMGGMGDMGGTGHGGMGGMGHGGMGHGGMNGMGGGDHDGDHHHLLWNWAYGRDFSSVATDLTLEAGEADTFRVTWPGTTNEGAVADTGLYRVAAMILSQPPIPMRQAELVVGAQPPPPGSLVLSLECQPESGLASAEREMRLRVDNPTDLPVTLHFRNGQLYDFSVFDPMSMRPGPIWTWSHGREFDPTPVERTIEPHGRLEFVEHWDCTNYAGMPAHPGAYEIRCVLAVSNAPAAPPGRVEITRP
jgi:hypothetical protein